MAIRHAQTAKTALLSQRTYRLAVDQHQIWRPRRRQFVNMVEGDRHGPVLFALSRSSHESSVVVLKEVGRLLLLCICIIVVYPRFEAFRFYVEIEGTLF